VSADVSVIRDVTDWIFDGAEFEDGYGELDPNEALAAWGPWVRDMTALLDGDGAWAHFPYSGGLFDQPARDMQIYSIAKNRWVERINEKLKAGK